MTPCARWVLILYQSRAEQTDQSCLLHTSIHEFQKIISKKLRLYSDCAHADPRSHHLLIRNGYQCLRYTAGMLKLQESKKQRFATLTNDEYATLSPLLQERESNNTRRATDMAVRTFDHTSMTKLLIKICALNCTVGQFLLLLYYKTIVDYGGIEYDVLFTRKYEFEL